jgi:Zinc finger, C3HC4 type (RING finger)
MATTALISTGDPVCVICHDSITAIRITLPCHCAEAVFCRACFEQYERHGYESCPVCRQPIGVRETKEAYGEQTNASTEHVVVSVATSSSRPTDRADEDQTCQMLKSAKLARVFYSSPWLSTAILLAMVAN